jgi:hypothetical protein
MGKARVDEDHAAGSSYDGPSWTVPGRKELAMAGSEQRPTDDVEGHGFRHAQDTEAADDDRGKRNPDDVEGHMPLRRLDTQAVDEDQVADDVAGHGKGRAIGLDTEAVDEDDVAGHSAKVRLGQRIEAGDEVEGHAFRWGQDTEAADEDKTADDTEGHFGRYGG